MNKKQNWLKEFFQKIQKALKLKINEMKSKEWKNKLKEIIQYINEVHIHMILKNFQQ